MTVLASCPNLRNALNAVPALAAEAAAWPNGREDFGRAVLLNSIASGFRADIMAVLEKEPSETDELLDIANALRDLTEKSRKYMDALRVAHGGQEVGELQPVPGRPDLVYRFRHVPPDPSPVATIGPMTATASPAVRAAAGADAQLQALARELAGVECGGELEPLIAALSRAECAAKALQIRHRTKDPA